MRVRRDSKDNCCTYEVPLSLREDSGPLEPIRPGSAYANSCGLQAEEFSTTRRLEGHEGADMSFSDCVNRSSFVRPGILRFALISVWTLVRNVPLAYNLNGACKL